MTTESTLTIPLPGGLVLERVLHPGGLLALEVRDGSGTTHFAERIAPPPSAVALAASEDGEILL